MAKKTKTDCGESSSTISQTKSQTLAQNELRVKMLNEDQKRKALEKYRQLYNNIKDIDSDGEFNVLLNNLSNSLRDQDDCLQEFGVNELISMDAKSVALTSELSFCLVKKFNTSNKFDNKEFIHRLKRQVLRNFSKVNTNSIADPKQRSLSFYNLYATGLAFNNLHYQTPAITNAYKPNYEAPVPTQRSRSQRTTQTTQKSQPTQYDSTNMKDLDESDKRLNYIFSTLKKLEKRNDDAVPFLQASFNAQNFSTTVENMFNMAFLARQSLIKIFNDEESIEPVVRTLENDSSQNNSNDIQSVLSLDIKTYKQLLEKLEITRSVFK